MKRFLILAVCGVAAVLFWPLQVRCGLCGRTIPDCQEVRIVQWIFGNHRCHLHCFWEHHPITKEPRP